jgi:hypothetical protein
LTCEKNNKKVTLIVYFSEWYTKSDEVKSKSGEVNGGFEKIAQKLNSKRSMKKGENGEGSGGDGEGVHGEGSGRDGEGVCGEWEPGEGGEGDGEGVHGEGSGGEMGKGCMGKGVGERWGRGAWGREWGRWGRGAWGRE